MLPNLSGDVPDWYFESPPDQHSPWWVAHIHTQNSRLFLSRLRGSGVGCFLPMYQPRQSRKDRRQGKRPPAYRPLFPGYAFLRGDGDARSLVVRTNYVVQILSVNDQQTLHDQLSDIYRLICAGVSIAPEDNLCPGKTAEIVSGPLAGFSGKVRHAGSKFKLVVDVNFIQKSVSVEVDRFNVREVA